MKDYIDNWLGQIVQVKLFGAWRIGKVTESIDSLCAKGLIVELTDDNKQIKVLTSWQALRRIDKTKQD